MLAEFLGFTNLESTLWNLAAYIAFAAVITGVLYERWINVLYLPAAVALGLYAGMFIGNPVFAALQSVIGVSAFAGLTKFSKKTSNWIVGLAAAGACIYLLQTGALADYWAVLGSLGLLGIAFGLVVLPHRKGFLLMVLAGIFLTGYAYESKAWVFFFLNAFFVVVSFYKWREIKAA